MTAHTQERARAALRQAMTLIRNTVKDLEPQMKGPEAFQPRDRVAFLKGEHARQMLRHADELERLL